MRKILFRGKRIDNGEWVYGYYSKHSTGKTFIRVKGKSCTGSYEVAPHTVGQLISGLTDKNGKRIFDGDIVHYQCSDVTAEVKIGEYRDTESRKDAYGCYVEFVEDNQIVQEVMSHMESNETYGCEVIGNIHDNTELLKGE